MRSSSNGSRAKVSRGAAVLPFRPEPLRPAKVVTGPGAAPAAAAPARAPRTASEREREEAYRAGYQAALEEAAGRQQAQQGEAAARLTRAADALLTAAAELQAQREKAVTVAEDDMSALAFEVAEAVLQRELELSADPGREAVARALRLVPPQVEVTVRLHPDDAAAVDGTVTDDEGRLVSFVADPEIEPGGCVAEAGACRVDAQVATALARVRRVLSRGHHR